MTADPHSRHKALIAPLRAAMYEFATETVRDRLSELVAPDAPMHLAFPFETLDGPAGWLGDALGPLKTAMPDLERRDHIVMAGADTDGAQWVGCGGYYCGTFAAPFLDIPPTGHMAHMRFHEFFRFEDNRVVEMQALWDIPELIMQAGAWPMGPSLGREWHIPGPATQDGLVPGPHDEARSVRSRDRVIDMLEHMKRHPAQGGPDVMEMERFWHERMSWYGPSGIGTGRGIGGFRHWHQIPFLNGMPDRGRYVDEIDYHFFGDGDYVAVTGWPDMIQTVSAGGWLGIAPSDKRIEMRSLDFWRLEGDRIRENWVMVDLLHAFDQLGVDVLARMREYVSARRTPGFTLPEGLAP
ncbi:ester cyclase [Oceanomicrobium pacificus]|uniref:Polyketide cyclase n=1 Tax=Oceanomicrobium pacificus TaxID=2692916 RepID=A0A6B0TSL7_9RHOB|nr:ester cyclase [Oceanomicrobium pacificus]MXU64795.1 polyketide cyclase [Oceanomicrobium pacificus]